jgi:anthranilate phosphoribosyltransferase
LETAAGRQVYTPADLGCEYVQQSELFGGANVEESANMLYKILQREGTPAQTNAVLANAGAALWVAEKAPSLVEGFAMAKESLESGKAFQVFKKFIMD